jgi:threonylcarbamoyladenosine tRNA methylthiotransferase MtaB
MTINIHTFGCRLNTYESEVMRQHALAAGMEDTIIFNTCAVTAEAERQARQAIRRARRENPKAKILVTGCAAQVKPESFAAMEEVDRVIGNEEKLRADTFRSLDRTGATHTASPLPLREGAGGGVLSSFAEFASSPEPLSLTLPLKGGGDTAQAAGMKHLESPRSEKILVNDIMSIKETASHLVAGFEGRARAFVQVQNGCNHRCTFCIIPYGRGNSRSVPMGEIVAQTRLLVTQGYKEIVITGVDISDYGKDLPGAPTLGQMLRRLLKLVPELPRLRLSSIDAVEVDDDLYRLIAEEPRLMPHLHISLQAGDDLVLKRMKRRHLRKDAVEFCKRVRGLRPDVVFGADVIAGFPTETEAMFQNTLDMVDDCGLTWLHVFPYSAREGTPAARMPQVEKPVRKQRAARLREKGAKAEAAYYASCVGKEVQLLVEDAHTARTEHFALASLPEPMEAGMLAKGRVAGAESGRLRVALEAARPSS